MKRQEQNNIEIKNLQSYLQARTEIENMIIRFIEQEKTLKEMIQELEYNKEKLGNATLDEQQQLRLLANEEMLIKLHYFRYCELAKPKSTLSLTQESLLANLRIKKKVEGSGEALIRALKYPYIIGIVRDLQAMEQLGLVQFQHIALKHYIVEITEKGLKYDC